LAMQFHGGLINLACEGLPLRTVNLPHVLPITLAKSTPEIKKVFADLGTVAGKPSDDCGARRRGDSPSAPVSF
jgi:hypothetical protein